MFSLAETTCLAFSLSFSVCAISLILSVCAFQSDDADASIGLSIRRLHSELFEFGGAIVAEENSR